MRIRDDLESNTNTNTDADTDQQAAAGCTITVCRGCCCGTSKVPRVDHTAQVTELRALSAGVARVRTVDCLGPCEQANIVVVQPSRQGRAAGGRPTWLGLVNEPDASRDILAWVTAGGPGLAEPPDILELHTFTPPRRLRHQTDR